MRPRLLPLALSILSWPLLVSCSAPLLDKASDEDANHALSMLDRHGIAAHKRLQRDGAWQVAVDAENVPAAAGLVDAYGLPARRRQTLEQLFGKKSFISTPAEEQVRLLIGLNNDVAAALEHIDGVLHAEVQIGLPRALQRDSLPAPQAATVLLRHDSSAELPVSRDGVRRFVADAAGGLDPSQVSVLLVPVTPDAVLASSQSLAQAGAAAGTWWLLAGVLALAALGVAWWPQLRQLKWPSLPLGSWRRGPRPSSAAASAPLPPRAGQAGRAGGAP